jgi:predicted ATPase/DNA-binding winged helix-turn-helix (wHTH) protein
VETPWSDPVPLEGDVIYAFAEYELDTRRCELRRSGEVCHLEPQAYDVLAYLLAHRDRLVRKEELLATVWGNRFVTPGTLNSRLKAIRQAIGDDGKNQAIIRTVRGRGFRFVAPVRERDLSQKPESSAPAPAPAPARAPARPHSHLVGRGVELECLEELFEAASSGARQLAFVGGEPGIGKTTLIEMFFERVRAQGRARIGRGQCLDQRGAGEPYMPVLEALGRLCREREGAELIALLERYAPTWLVQMPSLLDAAQLEAARRRAFGATRERMLREMVEALDAFAARTPLVLLLEDLHWSDPSTLDLLAALGHRPEPAQLLVIATYRSGEADDRLTGLVRALRVQGRCNDVTLGTWTDADVRDFLAIRFAPSALPPEVVELVIRRTEGHPLFIRTLVDEWHDIGAFARDGTEWRVRADLGQLSRTVPETLRASIEQRIDQLAPASQELLEAASVAGVEFPVALVAAALGWEEEQAEAQLRRLVRQGWVKADPAITEWADRTLTAHFAFTHHLYREVMYARLPLARRARLHERIGHRLESAHGDRAMERATELALHFALARDDERAVRYLRHAARHALARSAHHEAIGHLTAALEILHRRPDLPNARAAELELQRLLAPSLLVTRGWGDPDAERAYHRARALSEMLDDQEQLASVLYGLAYLHEIRGEYARSQSLIEERLTLSVPSERPGPLLEAHELLSCSLFHQGSFEAALQHARDGLDLQATEHRNVFLASLGENAAIACFYWAGLNSWFLGRPDEAVALVQRAIDVCGSAGHIYMLSLAEAQAARLFQHRREAERAAEHAERSLSIGERQGYPYQRAIARTLLGWAEVACGSIEPGLRRLRQGLHGQSELGAGMERPYSLALLADALAHAGEDEAALAAIDESLAVPKATARSFFWEAELHRLRGVLLLRHGDAERAEASLRQAIRVAAGQRARSLELRAVTTLCRLHCETGRAADAPRVLHGVLDAFTEGFDTPDLRDAFALRDAHPAAAP